MKLGNKPYRATITKVVASMITLVLLQSCTSLKDFQKMSPESRAQKTCGSDSKVMSYNRIARSANSQVIDLDRELSTGYKTITKCEETVIKMNIKEERDYYNDKDYMRYLDAKRKKDGKNKNKNKNKNKDVKKVIKTCNEHIIVHSPRTIDAMVNRRNILMNEYSIAKQKSRESFSACFDVIKGYDAKTAYEIYDN